MTKATCSSPVHTDGPFFSPLLNLVRLFEYPSISSFHQYPFTKCVSSTVHGEGKLKIGEGPSIEDIGELTSFFGPVLCMTRIVIQIQWVPQYLVTTISTLS